ncbi:hypothetical protein [Capnocytophaga haemolytica]|jgi:hypothetical protein
MEEIIKALKELQMQLMIEANDWIEAQRFEADDYRMPDEEYAIVGEYINSIVNTLNAQKRLIKYYETHKDEK